jgi:hypothetical protein
VVLLPLTARSRGTAAATAGTRSCLTPTLGQLHNMASFHYIVESVVSASFVALVAARAEVELCNFGKVGRDSATRSSCGWSGCWRPSLLTSAPAALVVTSSGYPKLFKIFNRGVVNPPLLDAPL